MNKRFMSKVLVGLIFVSAIFQTAGVAEPPAAEDEKTAKKGRLESGERPLGKPPMADLSAEDWAAVKKALQAVWGNPEVLQARDEVKRATETFHKAIKEALGEEDARVAALVGKMHNRGKGHGEMAKRRPGFDGRGGKPPMGKKPGFREHGPEVPGDGRGIGPAGFMAFAGDFSDEEKKRLSAAREKAVNSEGYKAVQEKLNALNEEGEDLRQRRVEIFHQTREELTKAMIEADPEVKVLLEQVGKRKKARK